jgi:putative glutamine amidotransferase
MRLILLSLITLLVACSKNKPSEKLSKQDASYTILISKAHKLGRYKKWLDAHSENLIIHHLYELSINQVDSLLPLADGILISGGEDVEPSKYGKGDQIERCGKINLRRDSLEIKMINYAMTNKIPLFGICRGEQLTNVSHGGTLIIDIPTDIGTDILHRGTDSTKAYHAIEVVKGSLLDSICLGKTDTVRSSHHQAVEFLAPGFMASAYSPDSIIEAIELIDKSQHPFVLGVQWHPEKMGYENVLSGCFANAFLNAVKN